MLERLIAYFLEHPWLWVLAGPCLMVSSMLALDAASEIRLKRVAGVRATAFATTPYGAIERLAKSAWMMAKDRFPEQWPSFFIALDPSDLRVVEMRFLGRRFILTEEPEHVKAILTGKFTSFGKGKFLSDSLRPFLGDSIFTTDGELWHQNRSLIRPMFTTERIRDLDIFGRGSDRLLSKIPSDGTTVDMCDLLYRMTLDITTDYLLGHGTNSLENPNGGFAKSFDEVQHHQAVLTVLGPLAVMYPKRIYYRGIRELERFIQPVIDATLALTPSELEKLSKSDKEFTFLHNVALFTRDPKIIRDQIMAVLLAGRDTTASTLSWTLYELSANPGLWQKLRRIVLEHVGPIKRPTYKDIKDLTYLTHTLNETLRLYPALPFNMRTCLSDSTIPGKLGEPDIAVLKGDVICYGTLSMQRRKDLYPPVSDAFADPAVYSPDRWTHWTPKPWQFVPFNGGPRICIGQNFAMTEMAFVMVRLLQKYERIEYRGDWAAQSYKTPLVGRPGQGVPMALHEPEEKMRQ